MNQPAKRSALSTVLPVAVIVAAGIVAFLLVMLFTSKKSDSSTPQAVAQQSTLPAAVSSAAAAPAAASVNGSHASGAASPSSQSPTAADFPSDATTTCTLDSAGNLSTIRVNDVRNKITETTCGFDTEIKGQLDEKLAADPQASSFTLSPYSDVMQETRDFACTRANHLTTCTSISGGDSVIYIKDSVN